MFITIFSICDLRMSRPGDSDVSGPADNDNKHIGMDTQANGLVHQSP